MSARYPSGTLVSARGRQWVVQPGGDELVVPARPLDGDTDLDTCLLPGEIELAAPALPGTAPGDLGDSRSPVLLRTALRLNFASGGPFRSLAALPFTPRHYQLVPLLQALRMTGSPGVVRLLIADEAGLGKTIEAGLIAKELIERGEAAGLGVLCPPMLAPVWRTELRERFDLDADRSPEDAELVIVDEAHAFHGREGFGRLRRIAADPTRHLILITSTPHSGHKDAFRRLLTLLDRSSTRLDPASPKDRERLARHVVRRRRDDVRRYLDQDTPFPRRTVRDLPCVWTPAYAEAAARALAHARDLAAGPRANRWPAMALLRTVASSPRAAAAALLTPTGTATPPDAAAARPGRHGVLDLDDAGAEGRDLTPGALTASADAGRSRELAAAFRACEGKDSDAKLSALLRLLAGGGDAVVFCRFAATADYLAEHLTAELPDTTVGSVTGALTPSQRADTVASLAVHPGRKVLVTTDALPADVALPAAFDAVVHYDLAWHPGRHEWREALLDRPGRDAVHSTTMYTVDGGPDTAVFTAVIAELRESSVRVGIAAPAPDSGEEVIDAIADALLLKGIDPPRLTSCPELADAHDRLRRTWTSLTEKERAETPPPVVRPEDVRAALDAVRAVLGEQRALGRAGPVARARARRLLNDASAGVGPVRRCAVTRTSRVSVRTTLLLLRYRFHVHLPGRAGTRVAIDEDAQAIAYRSAADGREWLDDGEVEALLGGDADGDVPPAVLPEPASREAERAIAELDGLGGKLAVRGATLAASLAEAYRRVRGDDGEPGGGEVGVKASGRPDVVGVFVYLPAGSTV